MLLASSSNKINKYELQDKKSIYQTANSLKL